jgi:hypothetical protein
MRSGVRSVVLVLACCLVWVSATTAEALAATPTITGISPNNGPDAGGTSVAITGTGFITGSTVKFGSAAATGVTIHSSESVTATSPAGSGSELIDVTVTNSNGTSASVHRDQFAYDALPIGLWLGLNGNSSATENLGAFTAHNIVYDRGGAPGINWESGELLEEGGKATEGGGALAKSIEAGMIPDVLIDYKGYEGNFEPDPNFPQERTKKEEEEGKNTIKGYVEGFVKSAKAIHEKYPNALFEPINEPWGYTTPQDNGAEYANIIAELLPAIKTAGIPLSEIYVAAYGYDCTKTECGYESEQEIKEDRRPDCHKEGRYLCGCEKEGHVLCVANDWVSAMYAAHEKLMEEIRGWYFHPYGPVSGAGSGDSGGIESLPPVQETMTSGQNNIIVSEIGWCVESLGVCEGNPQVENGKIGAEDLTDMLDEASRYHAAGWLRALIIYGRGAGGFGMESKGVLTNEGEALDAFAETQVGWAILPTPVPSGAKSGGLLKVDCLSSTECIGVSGYTNSSKVAVTLAERWNGAEWSIQSTPNPSGAKSSGLAAVACPSAGECFATGSYTNSEGVAVTLAEHWNGKEWSLQSTPNPSGAKESHLSGGVSCTSSTACTAVGQYVNSSGVKVPLAERWNGKEWSLQTPAVPGGATESLLLQVACPSSTVCIAAGEYKNSSGVLVTLAERWNGTEWSIQTTPNPSGAKESILNGMSCTSSTECTAVGHYVNSSSVRVTLAERWNGTEWSIQSTPNPSGAKESVLRGAVACTSATECTAAGNYTDSAGTEVTLVEFWNGKEWTIKTSPNPSGAKGSRLRGLSCTSSIACVGVGEYENSSGVVEPLAEANF